MMANIRRLFDGLAFDDAPQEKIVFDSNPHVLVIELDLRSDERGRLEFIGTAGFHYEPTQMVDRSDYFVDGEYVPTVLEDQDSDWIKLLQAHQERSMEPIS